MRTLIVGVGALGGVIGARLLAAGHDVSLATRHASSAEEIRSNGLKVTGIGGDVDVLAPHIAPLNDYTSPGSFDLILLATKAHDATVAAPGLIKLLAPNGLLLPIQNGGVPARLAELLGGAHVLGGLSNLGATMVATGVFEQRNAGYLLIGELAGGASERAESVREWLMHSVNVRVTENLRGAIWSKLLLNCSVTTIGALAGCTMQEYIHLPEGRELFRNAYNETLQIAFASGNIPERMIVDPIPPTVDTGGGDTLYEAWLGEVLRNYGALKPSMLQDIEKKRITEIDFINGYVVDVGQAHGVSTLVNEAIADGIREISNGAGGPTCANLSRVLNSAQHST